MGTRHIEPGTGRTVLVVVPHAEDATLWCGGTIARWSDAGWRVVIVRVTDDHWASVGYDEIDTAKLNRVQLEAAAEILGVGGLVELGYPSDALADVPHRELREHVVRLIRTFRPFALVTFDPYAGPGDDDHDHRAVALAVDAAFRGAQLDKDHPEHFARGLAAHGAFERWYCARRLPQVTDTIDIAGVIDRKVRAALAHETILRSRVAQLRLQAETGGRDLTVLDAALEGDLRPVVEPWLVAHAQEAGHRHGLALAEEWRVVRADGVEAWLGGAGA
jgi:LmbE family N-acetylglucosaminyl deacetylase